MTLLILAAGKLSLSMSILLSYTTAPEAPQHSWQVCMFLMNHFSIRWSAAISGVGLHNFSVCLTSTHKEEKSLSLKMHSDCLSCLMYLCSQMLLCAYSDHKTHSQKRHGRQVGSPVLCRWSLAPPCFVFTWLLNFDVFLPLILSDVSCSPFVPLVLWCVAIAFV